MAIVCDLNANKCPVTPWEQVQRYVHDAVEGKKLTVKISNFIFT
jgi:hypothetical protein